MLDEKIIFNLTLSLYFLISVFYIIRIVAIYSKSKRLDLLLLDPTLYFNISSIFYLIFPGLLFLIQGYAFNVLNGPLSGFENFEVSSMSLFMLEGIIFSIIFNYVFSRFNQNLINTKVQTGKFNFKVLLNFAYFLIVFIISFLELIEVIPKSNSYLDSYAKRNSLSLGANYLINFLNNLSSIFLFGVIATALSGYASIKSKIVLFVILAFFLFQYDFHGSRSGIIWCFLIFYVYFNKYVKQLSLVKTFLYLILLMLFFEYLGAYRNGGYELFLSSEYTNGGEMLTIFSNAVNIKTQLDNGMLVQPFQLNFYTLYHYIPSFLLPFEKLEYASWYVKTFYSDYGAEGGGNMFGFLAELQFFNNNIFIILLGPTIISVSLYKIFKFIYSKSFYGFNLLIYVILLLSMNNIFRLCFFGVFFSFSNFIFPLLILFGISKFSRKR
jgi:hypothetical protein